MHLHTRPVPALREGGIRQRTVTNWREHVDHSLPAGTLLSSWQQALILGLRTGCSEQCAFLSCGLGTCTPDKLLAMMGFSLLKEIFLWLVLQIWSLGATLIACFRPQLGD